MKMSPRWSRACLTTVGLFGLGALTFGLFHLRLAPDRQAIPARAHGAVAGIVTEIGTVKPRGADTPEMAVGQWLDAIHNDDLTRLIELSAPLETQVLHTYGVSILKRYASALAGAQASVAQPNSTGLTSHRVDNLATVTNAQKTIHFNTVKRDGDWYIVPSRAFVDRAITGVQPPDGRALLLAASAG